MLPELIKASAPLDAEFYVRRDGYFYKYDEYEELLWWCHHLKEWIDLKKNFPEKSELISIK